MNLNGEDGAPSFSLRVMPSQAARKEENVCEFFFKKRKHIFLQNLLHLKEQRLKNIW